MAHVSQPTPVSCGNCAIRMMIARALTKPVITDRETKRIRRPRRSAPAITWKIPARIVVANRYWIPWSRTRSMNRTAIAPVAAEIMAGRPPAMAVTTAIEKEA